MSGIIFDIKGFAIHDGPGIRTSIFFKGCPLRCWWCHNPESFCSEIEHSETKFKGKHTIGAHISTQELLQEVQKDALFYEQSGGGVTFTGGEPLLQPTFLQESALLLKSHGFHLALDTSGFAQESTFKKSIENMDLVLFDLKIMDPVLHNKYTGVSNQPILKNLEFLAQTNIETIIRLPIIPGINDHKEQINVTIAYLLKIQYIKTIELMPFHKIGFGKYERLGINNKMLPLPKEENISLKEIKSMLNDNGFKIIIA